MLKFNFLKKKKGDCPRCKKGNLYDRYVGRIRLSLCTECGLVEIVYE